MNANAKTVPRSPFRRMRLLLSFIASTLLIACGTAPSSPLPLRTPISVPEHPDAPAYVIDPAASTLRVLAYRDGPLSRFGHDHVLIAPMHGVVHAGETAQGSGFRIEILVDEFVVDPPATNARQGDSESGVSDKARRDTRKNLLGPDLLDAANHPRITIESLQLDGARHKPNVTAHVTLRGVARAITFPAVVADHGNRLIVIADFSIRQSAFGIEPFSILAGGLRVRDTLDVRVRLTATRAE